MVGSPEGERFLGPAGEGSVDGSSVEFDESEVDGEGSFGIGFES